MALFSNHDTYESTSEATLRMTTTTGKALFDYMRAEHHHERIAFGLANQSLTAGGSVFLIREAIFPDRADLAEQSIASISPTQDFLLYLYSSAMRSIGTIIEFHTHPGSIAPTFSDVDMFNASRNARYIAEKFNEPVTLVLIVGNNRFDTFDGVYYERSSGQFRRLSRMEVLGRPTQIWPIPTGNDEAITGALELFDRQARIPGWNQAALEEQRVGIVGVGGNGAHLLQTLLSIGVGRRGFVAYADHDLVEASNLPRIPYACESQVGLAKIVAATEYARRKSPTTVLHPFSTRFSAATVQDRFKMATVLFFCGDSNGGRKEVNEFAVRYGIPLIDLGCDIQVQESEVIAGGQVRLVLPGENACLVCCRGYDVGQAALDLMDAEARAQHAAQGYVRGADAEATPSVANLNALTAQHAISQFLALVHGDQFAQWDYLHFDQFTGSTVAAQTSRLVECPLCGDNHSLLSGDVTNTAATPRTVPSTFKQGPYAMSSTTAPEVKKSGMPGLFSRRARQRGN